MAADSLKIAGDFSVSLVYGMPERITNSEGLSHRRSPAGSYLDGTAEHWVGALPRNWSVRVGQSKSATREVGQTSGIVHIISPFRFCIKKRVGVFLPTFEVPAQLIAIVSQF